MVTFIIVPNMVVCWCRWTPSVSVVINCVSAGLQNLLTTSKILVLSRPQVLVCLAHPGLSKDTALQHSILRALCISTWTVESKAALLQLHSVFLLSSASQQEFSLKICVEVSMVIVLCNRCVFACLLTFYAYCCTLYKNRLAASVQCVCE